MGGERTEKPAHSNVAFLCYTGIFLITDRLEKLFILIVVVQRDSKWPVLHCLKGNILSVHVTDNLLQVHLKSS